MNVHSTMERFFIFDGRSVIEISLLSCLARSQGWNETERRAIHRALLERGCVLRDLACRIWLPTGEERRTVKHYVGARIRPRILMGREFDARAIRTPYVLEGVDGV